MTDNINYKEIDKEMRPIVKILNEKGWVTKGCCQGHWRDRYNRYWGGFISFEVKLKDEYCPISNYYKKKPLDICKSKMRDGFIECKDYVLYFDGDSHKRKSFTDKSLEHSRFLKELKKWADELPRY